LGGFSVGGSRRVRAVSLVVDDHYEALTCQVVASYAGVVGAAELVVRYVEQLLEHHWVRYVRKVPLHVPVQGCGGSSLAKPWYDSSLVVVMRFRTASRWWPGRSSYAATSVLVNEA
jgi:hypothetical protein